MVIYYIISNEIYIFIIEEFFLASKYIPSLKFNKVINFWEEVYYVETYNISFI